LTASVAAAVVGDVVLSLTRLHDPATQGTVAFTATILCYALAGLCALDPTMVELTRPLPPTTQGFHPLRAVGLWAALVTPAAVAVAAHYRHDDVDAPILFAPTAVVALLVLLRLRGLFAERQRLDAQVAAREAYYREILGHTADAVGVVDAGGAMRYTNPAFVGLFGQAEVAGPFAEVVDPADRAAAKMAAADALAGTATRCELRISCGDGIARWFDGAFSPLPDDDGGGVLVVLHDVTDRRRFEAELRHQALHDALTGLPNRVLLMDRLDQSLSRGRRRNSPPALLFVDLDHFKTVNDSLGHGAGDQLLRAVADRLRGAVREEDTVVRLGGDEFAVLIEAPANAGGPETVADRLLQMLRPPFDLAGSRVAVSASIGIATADLTSDGAALLREADLAMYRAKSEGRNGFAVFRPEMGEAAAERLALETDLAVALEEEQFHLLYQPIMDLRTEMIEGVEALVRWDHPTHGRLAPDRFIPLAEDNGSIIELGRWVLGEATLAAARLPAPLTMSVNVSPRQLASDRFVADVEAALANSGLEPGRLVLEITESMLMHDMATSAARLGALKSLGVSIAVDDFGTGYSSLAYLQQFPIDVLKIDRSFIAPMMTSTEAAALVRALVEMGQALRLRTVAEGVEERQQVAQLQEERCDLAQGFLYSRPIEFEAFETFLAVHGPTTSATQATPLVGPPS
jgi:diguanylate cyclase (GGDEF)-like protein/PAS domain S-box-containing protein